tara:strand:- start:10094 stop:10720 length:627 start_codon:yes stop_codon:yes gene_type:complete
MPDGFLLTAEAVKKLRIDHATLKNRVRRLESLVSNIRPTGGREDSVFVKVTEEITPRVTTTLGKGKADIQDIQIDSSDVATYTDATEVKSYGADPTNRNIEIYNDSLIPIAVDSYIRVSRNFKSGAWMPSAEVQTIIGYALNGVPGRSGTTAGSATIKVYYLLAGVLEDSGETITGYNIADVAIGVASYVMLKKHALSENWFIDFAEC